MDLASRLGADATYGLARIAERIERSYTERRSADREPVRENRCHHLLREISVLLRIESAGSAYAHPYLRSSRVHCGNLILRNPASGIRRRELEAYRRFQQ